MVANHEDRRLMRGALLAAFLAGAVGSAAADWRYAKDLDMMTDKETQNATLESNNSLDLPFPYAGRNYGTLHVRKHPKYGLDVILTVDKGQIMCNSYNGCTVSIKFDDQPPIRFSGTESSDHDSKVVFIGNEKVFIKKASAAKRILVQMTMFQAGEQVLQFHSSKPLEWPMQDTKKPKK